MRRAKTLSPGIPTTYKGLLFRSRLEATWATFLDALSLEWEYEALDLDGYIPDFILPHMDLLIEVKPTLLAADLWDHVSKIEKSGWSKSVSVVGAAFPLASAGLGLLRTSDSWRYERYNLLASVGITKDDAVAAWKMSKNDRQWMPSERKPRAKVVEHKESAFDEYMAMRKWQGPVQPYLGPDDPTLNKFWRALKDRPSLWVPLRQAAIIETESKMELRFGENFSVFAKLHTPEYEGVVREVFGKKAVVVA